MTALTICVPTPLSKTRTPDLSFVVAAAEKAAAHIRPGALVVLQSTTVPETTLQVLVPIFERATGGRVGVDFYLGYAPERVDPANRSGWTLRTTPKIVSGVTDECRRRTRLLYETVVDTVVEASSPTVAEMVKLYENTFRQVNIALANELALVCGRLGISAWEVIDAAATKPFGFMAHYPGPGLGGDCIPVVPHFISHRLKEYGYQTRMIEVAHEINTGMPEHVVGRVAEALNDRGRAVQGARILLLGVAYKPNVSDLRESPAMRIFVELAARGGDVRYCDPHVALGGGRRSHLPLRAVVAGGRRRRRLRGHPDPPRRVSGSAAVARCQTPSWSTPETSPERSTPEWSAFDGGAQEHAAAPPGRRNAARHRQPQRRDRAPAPDGRHPKPVPRHRVGSGAGRRRPRPVGGAGGRAVWPRNRRPGTWSAVVPTAAASTAIAEPDDVDRAGAEQVEPPADRGQVV